MSPPRVAIVLPARYHSTRFPGKPLAVVCGKPLIQWVYERARAVGGVSQVVVATDHDGIAGVVGGLGGDVMMTSSEHRTGTDRVAEVARALDAEVIVNLQGDEPVFSIGLVEEMIAVMCDAVEPGQRTRSIQDPGAGATSSTRPARVDIVTAAHPMSDPAEITNPNVVKVVMDRAGDALYFSRAPIPHASAAHSDEGVCVYRHVGIYVFGKESLLRFAAAERTPLECSESLEQLRALENGMKIRVLVTDQVTIGVDVPDDIKNVEKALIAP